MTFYSVIEFTLALGTYINSAQVMQFTETKAKQSFGYTDKVTAYRSEYKSQ